MNMLSMLFPDGSLEKPVMDLFRRAGIEFYANGGRGQELFCQAEGLFQRVFWMRPQESPVLLAHDKFDLAISGQDWVAENGVGRNLIEVMTLPVTRSGSQFVRLVLAVKNDSSIQRPIDVGSGVVYTEYPVITNQWFTQAGPQPDVRYSYGRTEGKALIGIADAIVELADSGRSLRENGLRIVADVFVSRTCLIASKGAWDDPVKRPLIEKVAEYLRIGVASLQSEQAAVGVRLVKCNAAAGVKDAVIAVMPAASSPTVSPLAHGGYAIESIVPLAQVNEVKYRLQQAGATSIIVQGMTNYIP